MAAEERRVLIFPPSRRDGEVTRDLLARHDIECTVCSLAEEVAGQLARGAALLVMTDAALASRGFDRILAQLAEQPPWSDLPVLMLCHPSTHVSVASTFATSLTNVTILDRPTSARTLLSTVQAAIRSRLRQYETREQLEALHRAEACLLEADRRKDEFLAMLAHELRGPLAPIRNVSEMLARLDDERTRPIAHVLKRQSRHLSRLVDDLLDVSRITHGRVELQRQPTNLEEVVNVALESVEPMMREKRHTVHVSTGGGTMITYGDAARLVQCVANVLTNAAKYTDPGGTIEVTIRREADVAVIAVADNGVGIAPELLPHVFELFVQADRSLDRAQGGLGIGLSVVRQLMEMHGGTLSGSSDGVGRGARFELRLPLQDTPMTSGSAAPARREGSRRVLVVDDNVDAADSLAMLLNMEGHDAVSVYHPATALERASALDPEVILLDIGLPVIDGYEVARRLRSTGSRARLIALTGYGQPGDVERARAAGFDSHLVKPVELAALVGELFPAT